MWDPDKKGEGLGWFAEDFDDSDWYDIGTDGPWGSQPIGEKWRDEHGSNYLGLAWYRTGFDIDGEVGKPRVKLIFGAVDEACVIWVNGEKVLDRPYPYKGDRDSWMQSFEVDITDAARYDRPNVVAVRVEANSGQGGVWRRAWVLQSN